MRQHLLKIVGALGVGLLLVVGVLVGKMWWDSGLPSTYSAMEMGEPDYGGGPAPPAGHERHLAASGGTSVAT